MPLDSSVRHRAEPERRRPTTSVSTCDAGGNRTGRVFPLHTQYKIRRVIHLNWDAWMMGLIGTQRLGDDRKVGKLRVHLY